jgi:hypothetical protein
MWDGITWKLVTFASVLILPCLPLASYPELMAVHGIRPRVFIADAIIDRNDAGRR